MHALGAAEPTERARAHDALVARYWRPVYTYLRLRGGFPREDAEDVTQSFFLRVLEKGSLADFDPTIARFRTYLRTLLDRHAANWRRDGARLRRGGQAVHVSLDFDDAEGDVQRIEVADDLDPDALFHREWIRALFARAVDDLEAVCGESGRDLHFRLFARYDLDPAARANGLTYAALATELDLDVSRVTNTLFAVRRRFREIVLSHLRAECTDDAEYRAEARALFGVDP